MQQGQGLRSAKPRAVLIRLVEQAPIAGTIYELEKLRCNLIHGGGAGGGRRGKIRCHVGEHDGIAEVRKRDALPSLGAAGKNWRFCYQPRPSGGSCRNGGADRARAGRTHSAIGTGRSPHNHDTGMRVLGLNTRSPGADGSIYFGDNFHATRTADRIVFHGPPHAGENLAAVLSRRAAELGPPIRCANALSRNLPKSSGSDSWAIASPHRRRGFVKVSNRGNDVTCKPLFYQSLTSSTLSR